MQNDIAKSKNILTENTNVLYGIFGIISTSGYFPSFYFLNEFLMQGSDPCDQDGRMEEWLPFELSKKEYSMILHWWQSKYPNTLVDDLNTNNWNDWVQEILEF